jgi:hypothetical protein
MRDRLGVLAALLALLWRDRMWWLVPAVLALLVVAMLATLGAATPLAPFIYPLF